MAKLTFRSEIEEKQKQKANELLKMLPDYVSNFNNHIVKSIEPSSRLRYLRDIFNFLIYVTDQFYVKDQEADTEDRKEIARKKVKELPLEILDGLTIDDLDAYFAYLDYYIVSSGNKEIIRTNNNQSIANQKTSVRVFYNYLFENDKIAHNPAVKLKTPKQKKKTITRMESQEVAAFLDSVRNGYELQGRRKTFHDKYGMRDTTLLSLMLGTGIRVSECVGLNLNDVDLKNHCIKVVRKGNKEDVVFFSDSITDILKDYLVNYRLKQVPIEGHESALFLSAQRKRIGIRSVENLVKKYAQESGVGNTKHITPHKLRSTFGTALYEETSDIYLVAETLGHASVDTTRKHYADISNKHKEAARNILDGLTKEQKD